MSELPVHLGGHMNKTHMDYGAVRYMYENHDCRSFIDVGCGPGGQVRLASNLGYEPAIGIDGDWTVLPEDAGRSILTWTGESSDVGSENDGQTKSPFFYIHDFSENPWSPIYQPYIPDRFDLAWSVEFLEHVEEQYIPNYMPCFTYARYAIVTHALPGQAGHHHVNCQLPEYWIDKFAQYGLHYSENLTEAIRDVSTMAKPFIKRTGLVFVNARIS
jgi:SAM-dependent methyltransferase